MRYVEFAEAEQGRVDPFCSWPIRMAAIAFSIFSVLNNISESMRSAGLGRVGKLVVMSIVKVEEKYELKASVISFGTSNCWLLYIMYIGGY